MTIGSLFGGRLVWADYFVGTVSNNSATSWYDYNETQANFSVARNPSGAFSMSMLGADTAGAYADGMACRVAPVAGSQNMEILFQWRLENLTENLPGIWLRGDGTFGTPVASRDATCYWLEADSDSLTIYVVKSVAGVGTVLGSPIPVLWQHNFDTWMRFAAIGPNFYGKAWATVDPEPNQWQLQVTDSSITSGNRFGFGFNGGASLTSDYFCLVKSIHAWDLSLAPVVFREDFLPPAVRPGMRVFV